MSWSKMGSSSMLTNEELLRGVLEGHVLIGDAPPPIRFETEDDEMLEQFGESIRAQKGIQCDNQPPDLKGITSLLRMVSKVDDEDDIQVTANVVEPSNCIITISKPSTLNPNVKEFVPKPFVSSHSSSMLSENKTCIDNTNVKETDTNTDKACAEIEHIDSDTQDSDTQVDVAEKLKNEISAASKSDTYETKKRKNVAITTLLNLYAKNESQKKPESLKLITPDFYENNNKTVRRKENIKSVTVSPNQSLPSITPACSIIQSEPAKPIETVFKAIQSEDTIMKKSIEKVNQWLNEPEREKKSSPVFLGPIAFKRKDPVPSQSPSNKCDQQKICRTNQSNQYQPSTYAADLGRKYMAKNKIKENKKINTWKDLHLILKERDEILVKKAN